MPSLAVRVDFIKVEVFVDTVNVQITVWATKLWTWAVSHEVSLECHLVHLQVFYLLFAIERAFLRKREVELTVLE